LTRVGLVVNLGGGGGGGGGGHAYVLHCHALQQNWYICIHVTQRSFKNSVTLIMKANFIFWIGTLIWLSWKNESHIHCSVMKPAFIVVYMWTLRVTVVCIKSHVSPLSAFIWYEVLCMVVMSAAGISGDFFFWDHKLILLHNTHSDKNFWTTPTCERICLFPAWLCNSAKHVHHHL